MISLIKERQDKVTALMEEAGVDAFLSTDHSHIRYFTSISPDKAGVYLLVIDLDGNVTIIAPQGTESDDCICEIVEYCSYSVYSHEDPVINISSCLQKVISDRWKCTGVDIQRLPAWIYKIFTGKMKVKDFGSFISDLLQIKDEEEISSIKKALELNSLAYDKVKDIIGQVVNEIEIYNEISAVYNRAVGSPVSFICDIVSGNRSIEVGGMPTTKTIEKGDSIIIDLLPCRNGYYCDTTRTMFYGAPTYEYKNAYDILLKAMSVGQENLMAGAKASTIYHSIMEVILKSGYGNCFPHHGGHGIGLSIFEKPYFFKNDMTILKAGMVVTLEPGIYIPEIFGIRLENNYLITEDGYELLFDYPVEFDAFII